MDDFELATQQKQIVAIKMRTAPSLDNKSTGQGDQFATIWTMELLTLHFVVVQAPICNGISRADAVGGVCSEWKNIH